MPSATEIIRQRLAEKAAKEQPAKAKAEATRLAVEQAKRDEKARERREKNEHKKEVQRTKKVADRILAASGVLKELEQIRRISSGPNAVLLRTRNGSSVELNLVWGWGFEITRDKDGNIYGFGRHSLNDDCDYNYFTVGVDTNSESLDINGTKLSKQEWLTGRQRVNDLLATAFLHPYHEKVEGFYETGGGRP